MNREEEVREIYSRDLPKEEKIRLLEEIEIDMVNEMAAQDQNMRPEIHNRLSEGVRLAANYLRELRDQSEG